MYVVKYAINGRLMCGKKSDPGVVGYKDVVDGLCMWRVDKVNDDVRLMASGKCLVFINYDKRQRTKGNT